MSAQIGGSKPPCIQYKAWQRKGRLRNSVHLRCDAKCSVAGADMVGGGRLGSTVVRRMFSVGHGKFRSLLVAKAAMYGCTIIEASGPGVRVAVRLAAVNILEHGLSLLRVQNPELYSTCVAGTKLSVPADPTAVSAGSASASIVGAGAGAGTP
jgi:hypothetical protein